MAYWRLFYHFVWTTKNREPLITPAIEPGLFRFLAAQARDMYCPFFVIGGVEDHVHVLTAVRPAVSPSEFMKQLKGSSSRFVTLEFKRPFEWQEGFGVFSVSESDMPRVKAYVERQKEHHAGRHLVEAWEQADHLNLGPDTVDLAQRTIE